MEKHSYEKIYIVFHKNKMFFNNLYVFSKNCPKGLSIFHIGGKLQLFYIRHSVVTKKYVASVTTVLFETINVRTLIGDLLFSYIIVQVLLTLYAKTYANMSTCLISGISYVHL